MRAVDVEIAERSSQGSGGGRRDGAVRREIRRSGADGGGPRLLARALRRLPRAQHRRDRSLPAALREGRRLRRATDRGARPAKGARAFLRGRETVLEAVEQELGAPAERLAEEVAALKERAKGLEKQLGSLRLKLASGSGSGSEGASDTQEVDGIKVLIREVSDVPSAELRTLADALRSKLGSGVVVLGSRGRRQGGDPFGGHPRPDRSDFSRRPGPAPGPHGRGEGRRPPGLRPGRGQEPGGPRRRPGRGSPGRSGNSSAGLDRGPLPLPRAASILGPLSQTASFRPPPGGRPGVLRPARRRRAGSGRRCGSRPATASASSSTKSTDHKARRQAVQFVDLPDGSLMPRIEQHARSAGLDPKLVRAVVQVESGYNPRALSNKGAMGLMQLMPETAQMFSVSNPYDPDQNLRAGTAYLRRLLDSFQGRLEHAVGRLQRRAQRGRQVSRRAAVPRDPRLPGACPRFVPGERLDGPEGLRDPRPEPRHRHHHRAEQAIGPGHERTPP